MHHAALLDTGLRHGGLGLFHYVQITEDVALADVNHVGEFDVTFFYVHDV